MAGLYPLSRYQQFDENGQLLVGARLFLFDGGTTTPRVGYRDSSLTTAHPNPIVADAAARLPLIYLADGFYRQRLTTASGVVVFDDDGIPVLSTTVGGTGTSVDPSSTFKTRDIKIRFDNQPIGGYVRLNGRTIGSVASGATERANADTQSLYEELWGYASIVVTGGKGGSGPADFLANKPLVLPNCAGRGIFGMDDMGAGAQGVLTAATIVNPTLVGSYGGVQNFALSKEHLPIYTLTGGSGTVAVTGLTDVGSGDHFHAQQGTFTTTTDAGHTHGSVITGGNNIPVNGTGSNANPVGSLVGGSTGPGGSHNHSLAISGNTSTVTHIHSLTASGFATSISINSGGSGGIITNLPPVMLFMIYIRL
jgi:hypothetical protein